MLEVGRHIGRKAVLIPTSDETAIFVDEYAEVLGEHFLFPHRPRHLPLAGRREGDVPPRPRWGFPPPRRSSPPAARNVAAFAQAATFPLLLKGSDTRHWPPAQEAGPGHVPGE